jgi:UDP-glucose:(heptosyl)LPS alpha-1,3-glucosyltransferase
MIEEVMKIAVVIPKYGLVGGAEGFASEVTERLARHEDLRIHVFANQWQSRETSITFHKVPTIPFPRLMRPISFAYFTDKRIKTGDYDIIHSHEPIFHMDLFTSHGIPHSIWMREVRGKKPGIFDRMLIWLETKGLTGIRTPLVMAVSSLVKDQLLRSYKIPESKILVIHPGVSAERFSVFDREGSRQQIRQRYGLLEEDVVVLFVGMNFEIKRLQLVIRGVADLVRENIGFSKVKLLVVGKGDKERYLNLARDLGIANRVFFIGVTHEVEKYYLASDIFAMPSSFDTFGMAVLEAMVAGLPVIITPRVGARDLIKSGVQGFILSKDPSPGEVAERLAALMEKKRRLEMGKNAREVALRYTWDRTADQVRELYHLLVLQEDDCQEDHITSNRMRLPVSG